MSNPGLRLTFTLSAATTIVLVAAYALLDHYLLTPQIAFVNSPKLMVGFSEAARVEKELQAQDEKWKAQLKTLQDSLQASIDIMSKEYDKASPARKKELQDLLSASNQQVNNFRQANLRKMEDLKAEKMKTVVDKINVYLEEFGKKHHYSMIFGTLTGGNLLYANERSYDVTDAIVKGLNERYK